MSDSGQCHGIDEYLPRNRHPGSVTVVCPACPEPEFNLQENWEKMAVMEDEYVAHLFAC